MGEKEASKVDAVIHYGLKLSPFLFAVIMDVITEEVGKEPPGTTKCVDGIVVTNVCRQG